jgi:endonuclease YncB( thermonuclease family)
MAGSHVLSFGTAVLVLAASAANPASDAAPAPERVANAAFDGPVKAEVIEVIDGDTFDAAARIWLGEAVEVHVRIEGIDAPELHARCPEERARALAARDYLARRISGGKVELSAVHYDKYGGRVDAVVRDDRGDIGQAMIAAGMARPYHGERRKGWCPA